MQTVSVAGTDIPVLGLGTWKLLGEDCARMVADALAMGWRHLDTAFIYDNEAEVGRGLRASGVARDQVFVTTKVWRDHLAAGELEAAAEASLKRLGLDHVDLLLIHWPNDAVPLAESLAALNRVKARGLTRTIGVANFPAALFEQACALSESPLVTNQVEHHPYLDQAKVLAAARARGSTVTAYCPLARGRVLDEPIVIEIARVHGVSPAQVALRWLVQQPAVLAIPKTASPERARGNLDVFSFALSPEETDALSALARPDGRMVSPDFAPVWDGAA